MLFFLKSNPESGGFLIRRISGKQKSSQKNRVILFIQKHDFNDGNTSLAVCGVLLQDIDFV